MFEEYLVYHFDSNAVSITPIQCKVEFDEDWSYQPYERCRRLGETFEAQGLKHFEVSWDNLGNNGYKLFGYTGLTKWVPERSESYRLENVFEAAKVYKDGKQYSQILDSQVYYREALYTNSVVNAVVLPNGRDTVQLGQPCERFRIGTLEVPGDEAFEFYSWLYISAIVEVLDLAEFVKRYDTFSDVWYPKSSPREPAFAVALARTLLSSYPEVFEVGPRGMSIDYAVCRYFVRKFWNRVRGLESGVVEMPDLNRDSESVFDV